ncbi:MAG: zinc ribbon domain-containing protein [Solirubrobacteraceae bacterium]
MAPRKARRGVERSRYVCLGRIADPASCQQPSIRREAIDAPFLATLLDGYIDLEATARRLEQHMTSAQTDADRALEQRERDVAKAQATLDRARADYRSGALDADAWSEERRDLIPALEAAKSARDHARDKADQARQTPLQGDAEQALLDYLATLKRAVTAGAEGAPDVAALRSVIGDLFTSVDLVANGDGHELRPWLRLEIADEDPEGSLMPVGHELPINDAAINPGGYCGLGGTGVSCPVGLAPHAQL